MSLKPEVSLGVGLATVGLVYGIFQITLPSVADERVAAPGDPNLASSERAAGWTAAAAVAGVSLIAKDPTVFILGGAATVALTWLHRHANLVDPDTGKAWLPGALSPNVDIDEEYMQAGVL